VDVQPEQQVGRELGARATGPGRVIYCAGALALTEPGPAAVGIVVANQRGRMLAQRSHYLGQATRAEASAQAFLSAARLAVTGGLETPIFRIDDAALVRALQSDEPYPGKTAGLLTETRAYLDGLPGHRIEVVPAASNRARAIALAPLVDWLPERTRRSENLSVRPIGNGIYEVSSESTPGQVYRVTLGPVGSAQQAAEIACECADFVHRGIPCKHLLAVARETDAMNRVFYSPTPGAR
jgi:hypothetical protein